MLSTTGPEPSASNWAFKQAWSSYLSAAAACPSGAREHSTLLDDHEMLSRLRGKDDDGFRGAMAECLVVFYFGVLRGVSVKAKPEDSRGKNVDLRVVHGGLSVDVEVKAPYVPLTNPSGAGADAKPLLEAIEKAGSQLKRGRANLVVLVPTLRTPVRLDRDQLLEATMGEQALSVAVSRPGKPARTPLPTFLQNGKLAQLRRGADGAFRTDLSRISAVMTIEETRLEEHHLSHDVVVVHNPFATTPIPSWFFDPVPQSISQEGIMGWSDDEEDG